LRFAAAPIIGKNQGDICGGGAAKYYLSANSTFAREARRSHFFGYGRTSVNAPRVAPADTALHARSDDAPSGVRAGPDAQSSARAANAAPKGTPATI
jgi:hypothetical protein